MKTAKVLDIENVGEPWNGRLLCVGWGDEAYAEPLPQHVLDELADPDIGKIVHTSHDHRWLRLAGYTVRGPVIDTRVMAWVVNERTDLDLATLTQMYVPHVVKRSRISTRAGAPVFECDDGSVVPLEDAPIEQVMEYNRGDLASTHALFLELKRLIAYEGLSEYYERDCLPFTETLVDMECRGVPVDVAASAELRERLEDEIAAYEHRLRTDLCLPADFNLGSSQQLGNLLFKRSFDLPAKVRIERDQAKALKSGNLSAVTLPDNFVPERIGSTLIHGHYTLEGLGLRSTETTDTGKPSTSAKTLKVEHGDNPHVQTLLEASSRRTVTNTFLKNFVDLEHGGRLYGRFNQTGTKTGRLSSSRPNLQNIPSRGPMGRAVRSLFRPEPGFEFVHGDYGQLEPRLMAHFSGDPVLTDIYQNGKDIYLETARLVFGRDFTPDSPERRVMKTYVLALGYGSGPTTLRRSLAEAGFFFPQHEVDDTYERLTKVYAVLFAWKDDVIADAENEGYVETLSGHRRHFGGMSRNVSRRGRVATPAPGGYSRTWREQGQDERQAVNAVIQGSAADIVARSMMRVPLPLLVQVHDELLWEVPAGSVTHEHLSEVRSICERGHGFDLRVPLEFVPKVIPTWAEGKD
jgi:DNA polymerase-1